MRIIGWSSGGPCQGDRQRDRQTSSSSSSSLLLGINILRTLNGIPSYSSPLAGWIEHGWNISLNSSSIIINKHYPSNNLNTFYILAPFQSHPKGEQWLAPSFVRRLEQPPSISRINMPFNATHFSFFLSCLPFFNKYHSNQSWKKPLTLLLPHSVHLQLIPPFLHSQQTQHSLSSVLLHIRFSPSLAKPPSRKVPSLLFFYFLFSSYFLPLFLLLSLTPPLSLSPSLRLSPLSLSCFSQPLSAFFFFLTLTLPST